MANVLNNYDQDAISKADYFETLKIYTRSHRHKRADGRIVPWIDENLNPFTGDWISRTRLKSWKDGTWNPGKGGKERGKDYYSVRAKLSGIVFSVLSVRHLL